MALNEYGNNAVALVLMATASVLIVIKHHGQYPALAGGHGESFGIEAYVSEIAIIGAGAWGTGIAIVLGRKGTHRVRLWAHEGEVCESIMKKRANEKFLPAALFRSV